MRPRLSRRTLARLIHLVRVRHSRRRSAAWPRCRRRQAGERAGRPHRVGEQARDRHRPDAARHRRDRARDLAPLRRRRRRRRCASCRPSRVTRLMPTSITVAPGLIQSRRTISGAADRGEQDVGAPADRRQVARLGMRDRHRRVLGQQQLRQRLADDVGAADHDRLEARERGLHGLGQDHAAERRARHQRRQAGRSRPAFIGMEAVDVLGRVDRGDDLLRVDLRRQRQAAPGCRGPPDRH